MLMSTNFSLTLEPRFIFLEIGAFDGESFSNTSGLGDLG